MDLEYLKLLETQHQDTTPARLENQFELPELNSVKGKSTFYTFDIESSTLIRPKNLQISEREKAELE